MLRIHPNVDIDAQGGAYDADRIRAVFEDMRDVRVGGGDTGQQHRLAPQNFRFRYGEPRTEQEDRVDGIGVVDIVRRDAGGVRSSGRLVLEHLPKETSLFYEVGEHAALADVLVADLRGQIVPVRIRRICRRLAGIKRNVAGAAGDADTVGADQVAAYGVILVCVIAVAIPFLGRRALEIRVLKQTEPHDPGGVTIDFRIDGGRLGLDRLIDPEAMLVGLGSLFVARFVNEPELLEPVAALAGVNRLEQINQTEAFPRHPLPELLIAPAPEVPDITALDLLRAEHDPAIHRLENIGCQFGEICRRAATGVIGQRIIALAAEARQHRLE